MWDGVCLLIDTWPYCEIKCSAFFHLRFGPDAAAVFVNDPLHRGQTDARAVEVFAAMQAMEDAEHLTGILHVESYSVVPHEQNALSIGQNGAYFDYRRTATPGEFDSVGKQVSEHLPGERRVALNDRQW